MGGFSAVLGNPPFLGGQKITGQYGDGRRTEVFEWVSTYYCKFQWWLALVRMKQAEAHRQTP
jgi:hypothetical protein